VRRILFENGLSQKEAVDFVKSGEGRADIVTDVSPLETLKVAESPFAAVVKKRGTQASVFGRFNMLKTGTPWTDLRVRQAANLAINRADLIQYGTNGNGLIVPALVPGIRDPGIAPYPFDPGKARDLLREAGYPNGIGITLIATQDFQTQATVVSKMLDQAGFKTTLQVLDATTFTQKTFLPHLDQPAEKQTWDIALTASAVALNFPLLDYYAWYIVDGAEDWVTEQPELRRLYEEALRTVDSAKQEDLVRRMEQHTHQQAYLLFLYNPVRLYAVNRAVKFTPYPTWTRLADISITDQHWSLRSAPAKKK
jgi:peptide/nickel transport system substrate-binding protein